MPWNFRHPRTGRFRPCRVEHFARTSDEDPMTATIPGDVLGDLYNDLRKQDVRDGCPRCTQQVVDNASEPDVMHRWGYR